MFGRFENPRRGMQARNLTTNVPKILDLKSSSEQILSKNWSLVPLSVLRALLLASRVISQVLFIFEPRRREAKNIIKP